MYGTEGVRFYTGVKAVSQRWSSTTQKGKCLYHADHQLRHYGKSKTNFSVLRILSGKADKI